MRSIYICVVMFVLAVSVSACDYNSFDEVDPSDGHAPLPNLQIGTLRERCLSGSVELSDEMVLSGYVTSSDRANNFYRTLMIEDNTGAAEILVGLYDLHNLYPVGAQLVVKCGGLAAELDDGLLRIGLADRLTSYTVTYMESRVVADQHLFLSGVQVDPNPLKTTLDRLQSERIGRLVRIENLQLDPVADTTWALPVALTGEEEPRSAAIKFREVSGEDSVYVYTSGYASFAGDTVPCVPVSITGILLYGSSADAKSRRCIAPAAYHNIFAHVIMTVGGNHIFGIAPWPAHNCPYKKCRTTCKCSAGLARQIFPLLSENTRLSAESHRRISEEQFHLQSVLSVWMPTQHQ